MKLSQAQIHAALEHGAALDKVERKAPSLDDLKSELGNAITATVDDDGQVNGRIEGKDALHRAWSMQSDYLNAKSDIAAEHHAKVRRVPMRDRNGQIRYVAEQNEDRSGRKHGAVRLPFVRWGRAKRVKDFQRMEGRVPFKWERE